MAAWHSETLSFFELTDFEGLPAEFDEYAEFLECSMAFEIVFSDNILMFVSVIAISTYSNSTAMSFSFNDSLFSLLLDIRCWCSSRLSGQGNPNSVCFTSGRFKWDWSSRSTSAISFALKMGTEIVNLISKWKCISNGTAPVISLPLLLPINKNIFAL